jgi:hypothetical protein
VEIATGIHWMRLGEDDRAPVHIWQNQHKNNTSKIERHKEVERKHLFLTMGRKIL